MTTDRFVCVDLGRGHWCEVVLHDVPEMSSLSKRWAEYAGVCEAIEHDVSKVESTKRSHRHVRDKPDHGTEFEFSRRDRHICSASDIESVDAVVDLLSWDLTLRV